MTNPSPRRRGRHRRRVPTPPTTTKARSKRRERRLRCTVMTRPRPFATRPRPLATRRRTAPPSAQNPARCFWWTLPSFVACRSTSPRRRTSWAWFVASSTPRARTLRLLGAVARPRSNARCTRPTDRRRRALARRRNGTRWSWRSFAGAFVAPLIWRLRRSANAAPATSPGFAIAYASSRRRRRRRRTSRARGIRWNRRREIKRRRCGVGRDGGVETLRGDAATRRRKRSRHGDGATRGGRARGGRAADRGE